MKLYHYWRSSTSWRVRWALALKKVPVEFQHVHLLTGEAESPEHLARNPQGYVPVLEIDGKYHTQSIAMIEMLDEMYPSPKLIFGDPETRFRIRQIAEVIAIDTTPIQNLAVLEELPVEQRKAWAQLWIDRGFRACEKLLSEGPQRRFAIGDQISLADICIIPQCYNALRQEMDLSAYPRIKQIYENALLEESCQRSHPERYKPIE